MTTGKVLSLYMTMPDLMRAGHRMKCEDIECDPNGIINDINYEEENKNMLLLVSQKSYEIIEEADLILDKGILMENIYVDIDLNHLKADSIIEIGDTIFQVIGPCQAFGYLYGFSPKLPKLLEGKRGIFLRSVEHGRIALGDEVKIIEEA